MKKKFLSIVLAALMLLTTGVFAFEGEEASSLYIQSVECPSDIMDYAVSNVIHFVLSIDEESTLFYDDVRIGAPFTYGENVLNLFTFPIFSNEKVVYTLRVAYAPDGDINGTMSTFLVDELNEYIGRTSTTTPLVLSVVDGSLVACLGDETEVVFVFPDDEILSDSVDARMESENKIETVNVMDYLNIDLNWRSTRDPMHNIALSRTEYQSGNNWCSAYVTAAILRTQNGGDLTARQVMQYYYGSSPSTSQALPMALAAAYARDVGGLTATTYSTKRLSTSALMAQIDDDCPVYLCMENLTSDDESYHAIALRGYTMSNSMWSIWNPNNKEMDYESFEFGGNYVSTAGNTFSYDGRTIYNYY